MIPLTRTSVHAVRIGLECAVDELTLYSTFQTALANSKAPDCERDHKSGALSLVIGTTAQLPDGRPGDGGDD